MSTHNICFCGEIRKIFTGFSPLSRPMIVAFTTLWAIAADDKVMIIFLFFPRKKCEWVK